MSKPIQKITRRAILPASCLALLSLVGCGTGAPARPDELRGTPYEEPLEKPYFVLNSSSGEPFSFREDTEGFVALLFFGYTHCPDVCPIHMANIAAVLSTLPPRVAHRVKVVMVTTDPDRDTPERLRQWLDSFNPSFVGLRGTLDEVNDIQQGLGLPPASVYGEGNNYSVGHSARVIAFTLDNRAHVSYPFGTRQTDWAHDLPKLVEGKWNTR
jgi:protein SCO1/2